MSNGCDRGRSYIFAREEKHACGTVKGYKNMALFRSLTRADKIFADQFEATDDGNFIYRQSQKGAPIKVWAWERDAFVDGFIKTRQRASWVLMLGMVGVAIAGFGIFGDAKAPGSDSFLYIGIGILTLGFLLFWRWAWKAPVRALADRQPQGPALAKDVASRAGLKRMSWGQFAWAGLIVVIGGARIASKVDILSGWNRLWLVGGFLYIVLLSWRIWQKWQADRFPD
jgi:hypothetical protein